MSLLGTFLTAWLRLITSALYEGQLETRGWKEEANYSASFTSTYSPLLAPLTTAFRLWPASIWILPFP